MRIGLKSGTFAILTASHIKALKWMRSECDKLIVMLNDDEYLLKKKGSIIVPAQERKIVLEELQSVDLVIIYKGPNEDEVVKQYTMRNPDNIYRLFHSPEMKTIPVEQLPGSKYVHETVFTPYFPHSSTSTIIERCKTVK